MADAVYKKVNGQVISIENMVLFEKAAEGLLVGKLATTFIKDKIPKEYSFINEAIMYYEAFYKALPYPLYAIESNTKYAAAGEFILRCLGDRATEMWVDKALYLVVDSNAGKAVKLVSNTWGIVEATRPACGGVWLESYDHEQGYEEYKWILDRLLDKRPVNNFYSVFMPKFTEACNHDGIVLRWELENMLNYGYSPEKAQLQYNEIYDYDTGSKYWLDIFSKGLKPIGQSILDIDLAKDSVKTIRKTIKTYGYEAYEKPSIETANDKSRKIEMNGLANLFLTLCGIKNSEEIDTFYPYRGLIAGGQLIFQVKDKVFMCKAYREDASKEIARNIEIYGYKNGVLYLMRTTPLGNGVSKETIYSIDLQQYGKRICKVNYVYTEGENK